METMSVAIVNYLSSTLARSARKGPFFLHPCKILQERSCILQDLVGICRKDSCRNFVQESCKISAKSHKIPQNPAGSCTICKILQGCKKEGSCKILQERFYCVHTIYTWGTFELVSVYMAMNWSKALNWL